MAEGFPLDPLWEELCRLGAIGGRKAIYLEETGSTNTIALERARQDEPAGTVVVANSQRQGRGRLHRSFDSPPGSGLYFSLILRPAIEPERLPTVTLAAGVAVAHTLTDACAIPVSLKWPNDLLVHGRKLGGILTEHTGISPLAACAVVVGVGINLTTRPEEFSTVSPERATSVALAGGRRVGRGTLLEALLDAIEHWVGILEREGLSPVADAWERLDALRGWQVTWLSAQGARITGVGCGLDRDGTLLVRDASGTLHRILSGDLTLAPTERGASGSPSR